MEAACEAHGIPYMKLETDYATSDTGADRNAHRRVHRDAVDPLPLFCGQSGKRRFCDGLLLCRSASKRMGRGEFGKERRA